MRKGKINDFVVIGLGSFGEGLINTLVEAKKNVVALDCDESKIERIKDKVAIAATVDSTNQTALESMGVKNADYIIVTIGEDFESGVLTIVALKNLNIDSSKIYVKAQTQTQEKVYRQLGITNIIMPEIETGRRLAMRLTHNSLKDFINLNEELAIVQAEVLNENMYGKTILQLDLRNKLEANIIAIKRGDYMFVPKADLVIEKNDILYIIIHDDLLDKMDKLFGVNDSTKKGSPTV